MAALALELSRRRMATLLRDTAATATAPRGAPSVPEEMDRALARWPTASVFDDRCRAALAVAERYVVDVSGTTEQERNELFARFGHGSLGFVQGLYLLDMSLRVEALAGRLFESPGRPSAAQIRPSSDADLWGAIEDFMRTVARLDQLDDVTTELVRLTGAREHGCRLCSSRRSAAALSARGDSTVFDRLVEGVEAPMTARELAAVRLTRAMLTQPAAADETLVAEVRRLFAPEQAMEIVWDVARNGANKIAVFFGADEPRVADGVELFETSSDGEVISELDRR